MDEGYLTAKPRSGYYVSAISRLPSGSAAQPRLRMLPAADAPVIARILQPVDPVPPQQLHDEPVEILRA